MAEYRAFYRCKELTDIVLPEKLTEIGPYAFVKCAIREITIPGGVKNIYDSAFYCCEKLERVVISYGVTDIWANAFSRCSHLKSITLPSTLKQIGDSAFAECKMLEELTIPGSVKEIGDELLMDTNIRRLTLPRRFKSRIGAICDDPTKIEIVYTDD